MSSHYLDISLRANGREVFTAAEAPAAASEAARTLKCGQNNFSVTHGPATTPAITGPPISRKITLAGSIETIDLTAAEVLALPSAAARTFDFTGKKVVAVVLRAGDANAAVITVAPGATNPYPLFGAGNTIEVPKGMALALGCKGSVAAQLPPVAAAVKDIDIDGTSGDILYIDLYLGS
jgi:hypothetical protein